MIEFKVSAPGKVILFGEHSVVYNKTAVASSIDLRTRLFFKELRDEKFIHILAPKVKIDRRIAINEIEEYFFDETKAQYSIHQIDYVPHIEKFVENLGYENDQQKMCLQAIIFLLIGIFRTQKIKKIKSFSINVETELTISSGSGSSASFAVCLAACFLHYSNILLNKVSELSYDCLKFISNYAFDCEKLMHGTPSGIDNTICTFGSLLYYKRDEYSTKLPCYTSLKIMLVDTKVQRNTKNLVQKVRDLKTTYPNVIDPIMEAMDHIAINGMTAVQNIVQGSNDIQVDEEYKKLGQLMEMNHHLLSSLGVSHPALDKICLEAKNCDFPAKLTGAGGGGYVLIMIPNGTTEDKIQNLKKKLTDHEFDVTLTTIGGTGVQIS